MELNNHVIKETYIRLMSDTLVKKIKILSVLIDLTERQGGLIGADSFDEEEFLQLIAMKDEQLTELRVLDDGFDKLFQSVKEELLKNKDLYSSEIITMKEHITEITDLSVKLQACEKRNKSGLEVVFTRKRRDIKNARMSSQSAANYYKAMTNQNEIHSAFYDRKN